MGGTAVAELAVIVKGVCLIVCSDGSFRCLNRLSDCRIVCIA